MMISKKMTANEQAINALGRIDIEVDELSKKSRNATALFYKMSEELHDTNAALAEKVEQIEALEKMLYVQKTTTKDQIEENNKTLQKIHEIIGYGD